MDQRISRFLKHHHVLTLSTNSFNGSWTSHCFYAFLPDHQALVFTSGNETRHGQEMLKNPNVSGGIVLETKIVGKIQGIQLTGKAFPVSANQPKEMVESEAAATIITDHHPVTEQISATTAVCRNAYLKRFPYALAMKLELWILHIDYIKMTDNRLGFGKKLELHCNTPILAQEPLKQPHPNSDVSISKNQ